VKLHLGAIEVPYAAEGSTTTGDVAQILEEKYGLFSIFYESHQQQIADDLAEGMAGTLESMISGRPVDPDHVFDAGTVKIEDAFHDFLLSGAVESMGIPGVPTQAALERESSRFKSGKADGPRPSFVDTGTLEAAFKAWIEDV